MKKLRTQYLLKATSRVMVLFLIFLFAGSNFKSVDKEKGNLKTASYQSASAAQIILCFNGSSSSNLLFSEHVDLDAVIPDFISTSTAVAMAVTNEHFKKQLIRSVFYFFVRANAP